MCPKERMVKLNKQQKRGVEGEERMKTKTKRGKQSRIIFARVF